MKTIFKVLILAGLTVNASVAFSATRFIELSLVRSGDDNNKFGEYNDFPESGNKIIGAFELFDDLPWSTGNGHWQMDAKNLGLGSYDFSYTVKEPSRYMLKLTLDGSQQYTRTDSKTPFADFSDGILGLSPNWIAAPTSTGMTAFDLTAVTFDEEVHRDSIDIEFTLHLNAQWQVDATYQSLNRQGTQIMGGAIYFDASTAFASHLPVEIDEDSSSYSVSLTYASDRLVNTISYVVSTFDDKNDQLTWLNPFSIPGNASISYPNGTGGLSLAPDNNRQMLRITGSHHPASIQGLSLQWDTAWSAIEQDGNLLPYSTNSALIITDPLPINDLDNSVDSLNGSLRLTYKPPGQWARRLLLRSSYSIDDRDHDKNRTAFNYIRGDGADQPGSILGIYANAHDYRKARSMVAADYRLAWWQSKATLEIEQAEVERENAAVKETDTDTFRGMIRFMPMAHTAVRIEATKSDRHSSTYRWEQSFLANRTTAFIDQTPLDQRFDNHPLLSQFHLASAETAELNVSMSYTGLNRWTFTLDYQEQDTDYNKTDLGLLDVETRYHGIDIQYLASARLTGYGMASWSSYESSTAGRSFGGGIEKPAGQLVAPLPQGSDPGRNWTTRIQDDVFTFSVGLVWDNKDKLSAQANYTFVQTESGFKAATRGAANLDASDLPDLETELSSLNVSLTYALNDKTDMTAIYQYFDFDESNWATQGVTFDTVPDLLASERSSLNGKVNLIGLSIKHRF